jgi:hypothetical protein
MAAASGLGEPRQAINSFSHDLAAHSTSSRAVGHDVLVRHSMMVNPIINLDEMHAR